VNQRCDVLFTPANCMWVRECVSMWVKECKIDPIGFVGFLDSHTPTLTYPHTGFISILKVFRLDRI
jgi:hypothetical protein